MKVACGFVLLIGIIWLGAILPGRGATYEVKGEVRTTIYKDGVVTHSRTNLFKASVDGCQFRARVEATGLGILYNEFTTAKDYSFEFFKYDVGLMNSAPTVDQWGFEVRPQPKLEGQPEASITVNPTIVPPFGSETLPWLAYGAQCYLSQASNGMILPPVPQDLTNVRTKYWLVPPASARWHFSARPPGLLEWLIVFRDGERLGLSAPFNGLTTNCVYEVQEWTNTSGLTVPRQFKLTRFAPDPMAKQEARLLVDGVFLGLVKEVSPRLSSATFTPMLSTNTQVFDHRFEDEYSENAIAYKAREQRILDYEELKRQARFRPFMK